LSKKNIWDPAEHLVIVSNTEIQKSLNICVHCSNFWLKHTKSLWIWDFHIYAVRDSQMISRKLLTNLKLFVEEKYLRSRRAPRDSTQTLKVKNHPKLKHDWSKIDSNSIETCEFEIFTFLLWETRGWSPENSEQFSNDLSRKNIWDPAEHLVLVPKHWKSKITQYIRITGIKTFKICKICDFWIFTVLLWETRGLSPENF